MMQFASKKNRCIRGWLPHRSSLFSFPRVMGNNLLIPLSNLSVNVNKSDVSKRFPIDSNGFLAIDFTNYKTATIQITSCWQDAITVNYNSNDKVHCVADVLSGGVTIVSNETMTNQHSDNISVTIDVPEMCNISVAANNLDLRVKNKVSSKLYMVGIYC